MSRAFLRFRMLFALTGLLLFFCAKPALQSDFYPLYFGAQRLLQGLSPYSEEAQHLLGQSWQVSGENLQVASIVAYPVPLLLLLTILASFSLSVAFGFWFALSWLSFLPGFSTLSEQKHIPAVVLFYPLWHAALLGTSSLLWLGLSISVLFMPRSRHGYLRGALAAVLCLKPQDGILVALFCLVRDRDLPSVRKGFLSLSIALLFGSLVLDPAWVPEWISALEYYRAHAVSIQVFPWSVILILSAVALPGYAILGVLQSTVFPINDLYSCLPLLLTWAAFRPAIALGASLITLAGLSFFSDPNSTSYLLWCVYLPLLICNLLALAARFSRYDSMRSHLLR